jgi:hypothetical protein
MVGPFFVVISVKILQVNHHAWQAYKFPWTLWTFVQLFFIQ